MYYSSIKSKDSISSFFRYLFLLILACSHSVWNYPCVRYLLPIYIYTDVCMCVCFYFHIYITFISGVHIRKRVFFCICPHMVCASRYDSQILRGASYLRSTFVYAFTHSRTAFPPYIEVTSVPCAMSVAGKREEEKEGEIGRENRRVRLAITGARIVTSARNRVRMCAESPLFA